MYDEDFIICYNLIIDLKFFGTTGTNISVRGFGILRSDSVSLEFFDSSLDDSTTLLKFSIISKFDLLTNRFRRNSDKRYSPLLNLIQCNYVMWRIWI